MRTLTFGYLTLSDCAQIETIDVAHASGFNSVGIRVTGRQKGDSYPFVVIGNTLRLNEIKRHLTLTGMRLSNISGNYLEPGTTQDDLQKFADAAIELGCPFILVNGFDADEGRVVANLAKLCELSQKAGVKVAVEFVPYQTIRTLQQAYRMVIQTGFANIGIVPDPLHLMRSGGSPSDLAQIDESRIFYAQICDAPKQPPATVDGCLTEARTARMYPGKGGLPLRQYLEALPADCEVEVEVANAQYQKLAPMERGRQLASALFQFMAQYEGHEAAASR